MNKNGDDGRKKDNHKERLTVILNDAEATKLNPVCKGPSEQYVFVGVIARNGECNKRSWLGISENKRRCRNEVCVNFCTKERYVVN